MRDLLGKKIKLNDDVYMLTCGTGGSLYKVKAVVVAFNPPCVRIREGEQKDNYTDIMPDNIVVI